MRSQKYENKGKSHLLHVGVDKEREYILNWMRQEYGNNEPYNVSEGIWIALANHIEAIEKYRSEIGYVPSWKKKYARKSKQWTVGDPIGKNKKTTNAQDKFFALVEKWGGDD